MADKHDQDLTGRKQIASNVLSNWTAQLVYVAAGFVMPKMISVHLGQTLLGVWDFAWSLVGYFSLVQLGVISSINRFVARYRADGDAAGVSRAVSSVTCVLAGMSALVMVIVTIVSQYVLPVYAKDRLGGNMGQAQLIVMFLGSEVAVQTFFSGFGGVLTGCHRWKLFNNIQAGGYALSVVGMIAALQMGGGLASIAFIHLCGIVAVWVSFGVLAFRIYPPLKVKPSLATREETVKMFQFGTKSFVPQMGELLLNQTVNILILGYLGPASLAIYSRPRNLVASVRSLIIKMASVLIPSSGSMQAAEKLKELQSLAIRATRYAAYMVVPFACGLAVMGGVLLEVWMGPEYKNDFLPGILIFGTSLVIILTPALCILIGMNHHGPPGWVHFGACAVTSLSVWLALAVFKEQLLGVAIFAMVPLTVAYIFYMPWYTAHCLKISTWKFVHESLTGPALAGLLLSICLVAVRCFETGNPRLTLLLGAGLGGLIMTPIYWKWAMPESIKKKLFNVFGSVAAPSSSPS